LFAAAFAAIMFCVRATLSHADPAAQLRTEYKVLSTKYAASVPTWRPKAPATGSLLFVASDQYTPAGNEREQYSTARNAYADSLFVLARKAALAGQSSLAFQWSTEAVRENPDHAAARRVLGYQQRDGHWLTAYGARMADAGKTWHPKFGWIVASDAPRYEAGERFVGGNWITADADAARHSAMKNGWQVRTDHFMVTTNHSLEAGVELATRLERLHQVWRQLFAGFYLNERGVGELFESDREPRTQLRPFRVYYHRDRAEYNAALHRRQPRIAETLGIYFDAEREAHFFAGDSVAAGGPPAISSTGEPPVATLYHEAVHQLFQESRPAAKQIGRTANFWIVEGVATYFESLTEHNDPEAGLYYTIGEPTAGRMPAARERLLDGFYLPLAEVSRLGKTDVQQHQDIARLYSQSAGLSAFLMHAEDGRYREALVRYLKAVYSGRDSGQTLVESVGQRFDELDAAYRRYMQSLP
jgi:hypothetical protein